MNVDKTIKKNNMMMSPWALMKITQTKKNEQLRRKHKSGVNFIKPR